jgi:hypothetical protein
MTLTVEPPESPDITNRGLPRAFEPADSLEGTSDLRRDELEAVLRDGAWSEAFNEWAEYTDLNEAEYDRIRDAGLLHELDFYWDPVEARLRFEVPTLPSALAEETDLASKVTAELTDLGHIVVEMLEDGYVDWGEGATSDDTWSEETFEEETPESD